MQADNSFMKKVSQGTSLALQLPDDALEVYKSHHRTATCTSLYLVQILLQIFDSSEALKSIGAWWKKCSPTSALVYCIPDARMIDSSSQFTDILAELQPVKWKSPECQAYPSHRWTCKSLPLIVAGRSSHLAIYGAPLEVLSNQSPSHLQRPRQDGILLKSSSSLKKKKTYTSAWAQGLHICYYPTI